MRSFESSKRGSKVVVTVVSVDEAGYTTLTYVETLTVDKQTNLIAHRTWRRAPRGSADPVWWLQNKDGEFQPVLDRDLVDSEVRGAFIRYVPPVREKNRVLRTTKHYVDKSNYDVWREKMKFATDKVRN